MMYWMISKQVIYFHRRSIVVGGLIFLSVLFNSVQTNAQGRGGGMGRAMQGMGSRVGGPGGGGGGGSDSLSFEKRKFSDDSVNVRFKYLDTARYSFFDSSISDFYKRIPMKPDYIQIGHNGNAIRPLLCSPLR